MRSWQSAKTPGGGSFGHPRLEECFCLTIHIATALHLFSALYTRRDIESDDSYAPPLIHACAQPIVWFERERKLRAGHRAETRQTSTVTVHLVCLSLFTRAKQPQVVSVSTGVEWDGGVYAQCSGISRAPRPSKSSARRLRSGRLTRNPQACVVRKA